MKASLVALTAGAILVLIACSMTWSVVTVPMLDDADGPVRSESLAGSTLAPLAAAAAWVALAAVLAVLATRSWGRVAVGVVVLAAGVLVIFSSVSGGLDSNSNLWWVLAVAGGVAIGCAGGSIVGQGRRWPGLGRRYEAPAGSRATPSRQVTPWDAIDHGQDPTLDDQSA
jgi:uncharacterized membrane protein (TIGR02234 family)